MKKLMIISLLFLSAATIDCKKAAPVEQEETEAATPWYYWSYKNGALVGAFAKAVYACNTFSFDKSPWKDMPAEDIAQLKEADERGALKPLLAIGGAIDGAIIGAILVATGRAVHSLIGKKAEKAIRKTKKAKAATL